jgi:glycosyltransferase involved in cell wall biosynthesis
MALKDIPLGMSLPHRSPDPLALTTIAAVARRAEEFDVIHSHVDYLGYPLLRRAGVPFLTTLHGRLDLTVLQHIYGTFTDVPVVSISDAQRGPVPQANYLATIQHGIPERLLLPAFGAGGYLAFLGRISPEKAPDAAIRIAQRAGMPIRIAAKVDQVDRDYFEQVVKPLLGLPGVEFLGEIGDNQKTEFLGNAAALLFPIAWAEPFGLAMIEAMACGTPVIAFRRGSVPEIVNEGLTGFIVTNEEEAAQAAGAVSRLDRAQVRRIFEERFTARRMAEDYLNAYRWLIARDQPLRKAV